MGSVGMGTSRYCHPKRARFASVELTSGLMTSPERKAPDRGEAPAANIRVEHLMKPGDTVADE